MKVLSAVAALLVASSAQAWSSKYVDVVNGRTVAVKAVDASNQDGIVSLRVILLNSSYDSASKTYTQDYELKVSWTPGADWSSCTVQVQHPSLKNNSVVLYVEGNTTSPIEEDYRNLY